MRRVACCCDRPMVVDPTCPPLQGGGTRPSILTDVSMQVWDREHLLNYAPDLQGGLDVSLWPPTEGAVVLASAAETRVAARRQTTRSVSPATGAAPDRD